MIVASADTYTQRALMRPIRTFDAELIFRRWIKLLERSGRRKKCLAKEKKNFLNKGEEDV
jgi:hypothetical protein